MSIEPNTSKQTAVPSQPELGNDLSPSEKEVLRELVRALRAIRYGSVNVTVHEGRIVEIQKTERIRK